MELVMKKMLLLFAIALTTIADADIATAETATTDAPFRFDVAQTHSHRGLGVEGYVYNGLPSRISNVRLRVDSVDANGAVTASASGWVVGDVKAGGRGYFYVAVPAPANSYRATVQSFDKVATEAPQSP
jgi:hypothetical protein